MAAFLDRIILSLVGGVIMKNFCTLNIRILHAMPGRIRLQCNAWKSEAVAARLADSLRRHRLVEQVSASAITGSLLIHFTQKHLARGQFDKFMDLVVKQTKAGLEQESASATLLMSRIVNSLDNRVKTATNGIFDLPSLFSIALATLAVKGFRGNRANSLQQLFWVYRLLRGGRQVI
ncbi:MAG: hypothetical protein DDT21_01110 [Syntrophomonadaceae bacterium]|nr:hypothetical protein [Bacillota bacterium]